MDMVKFGFLDVEKIQECLDMVYRSCDKNAQQKFAKFFNFVDYLTDEGEPRCKYKI
jgi:hypothetical protein